MKSKKIKNLLKAAKIDPSAYIGLGDAYEEEGDLQNAARARVKAGISIIRYRIIDKKTKESIKEFPSVRGISSYISTMIDSIENPYDKYEVRMYELRYVDIGEFVSMSQKEMRLIEVKDGIPYMRGVNLSEICVGRKINWNKFDEANFSKKEERIVLDYFNNYGCYMVSGL